MFSIIILTMHTTLKQFTLNELQELLLTEGEKKFRATQIFDWLYKQHVSSYDEMRNISQRTKSILAKQYPFTYPSLVHKQVSADGTRKYLLRLFDDVLVETVGIPSANNKLTVCCSSQAGCAMACAFCATGKQGLIRNLYLGEIVDQINVVADDFRQRVSNIVVMGQGEPFANYQAVIEALHILNNSRYNDIGARHITISTCGIVPNIKKLAHEGMQYTLAVSLHSAIQRTRNEIMPRVTQFPLTDLKDALEYYTRTTNRRVSLEYALIKDVNDSAEHLRALCSFCNNLLCHVNIIMLNKIENSPFAPVSESVRRLWLQELENHNIPATARRSRGADIDGACGQLARSYKQS